MIEFRNLEGRSESKMPWVVRGFLAHGMVTILRAKPKIGASTLAWGIAGALERAPRTFLGLEVAESGRAIIMSPETVDMQIEKATRHKATSALFRKDDGPVSFSDAFDAAWRAAHACGASLVIVDNLGGWDSRGGAEFGPVSYICEREWTGTAIAPAVLLIDHEKKGPGVDNDIGSVECVARLERTGALGSSGRRLSTRARWSLPLDVELDYSELYVGSDVL